MGQALTPGHGSAAWTFADASAPKGETLNQHFLMRIAGVPVTTVHGLRTTRTAAWADDVVVRDRTLAEQGAALSDELFAAVGGNEDEALRRRLVNARRQIFKNTYPRGGGDLAELAAGLPAVVGDRLLRWAGERAELDDCLGQGAELLGAESAEARRHLYGLRQEPNLRLGILLASPELHRALTDLPPVPATAPNKRQRKAERSFLQYIYRTACKTSPFSTFTGVALGRMTDAVEAADLRELALDPQGTGFARLNVAVLGRFAELIVTHPRFRLDLPMALTSGWRREHGRIRYVRRSVKAGDDTSTISFDTVKESMLFLRGGNYLDFVVDLYANRSVWTFAELAARVGQASGATAQECEDFIGALARLTLLQPVPLAIDPHALDPVSRFRDSVAELDTEWAQELVAALTTVAAELDVYPTADLSERREILNRLRRLLTKVLEGMGEEGATLPVTLVYEDVRLGGPSVPVRMGDRLDAVRSSLRSLDRLGPVFDFMLPHRLLFKGYFVARFGVGGRCDDVAGLAQDFQEEVYEQYLPFAGGWTRWDEDGEFVPQENWLGLPEVTCIDRGRIAFTRGMRRLAADPAVGEIVIDDDMVKEVAAAMHPLAAGMPVRSHFLQVDWSGTRPLGVLNRTWGGVFMPFSRFTHCFADAGLSDALRDTLRQHSRESVVYAEITGGFDTTNLNLHLPMTDYEIVCPAEVSFLPADRQLPLGDMFVVHDPEQDRLVLRSRRLGSEVVPTYLGYLIPMALPDIPAVLLLLSSSSLQLFDIWDGFPEPGEGDADGEVVVRPRVRHGDVVLSRRAWLVRARALPSRARHADDAAWYVDWRRWRAGHGLPAQLFATVKASAKDDADSMMWARPAKPHFVDFDSPLCLGLIESFLDDDPDALVTFTEMLPVEEGLHVRSTSGPHVAEIAVETFTSLEGSFS